MKKLLMLSLLLVSTGANAGATTQTTIATGISSEVLKQEDQEQRLNKNHLTELTVAYTRGFADHSGYDVEAGTFFTFGNKVSFIVKEGDTYLAPTMKLYGYREFGTLMRAHKDKRYYEMAIAMATDRLSAKPLLGLAYGHELVDKVYGQVQVKLDGGYNSKNGYLESAVLFGLRMDS